MHRSFDAIPGSRKRLMFWSGDHDDWPDEAIDQTIVFVALHASSPPSGSEDPPSVAPG